MIQGLASYINIVFIVTTLLTFYLGARATRNSMKAMLLFTVLLLLQAMLAFTGFYTATGTMPPRFPLMVMPSLLVILIVFVTQNGWRFLDTLSLKQLTWIHTVRIPVEIVLWWLYAQKQIPAVMTFEGLNFDIISGITAPLLLIFAFSNGNVHKKLLLTWNITCLLLLLNIVIISVLSSPVPFQQLSFDQPNTAMQYFPFVWLPAFIVPVVLFAHLASIRLLLRNKLVPVKKMIFSGATLFALLFSAVATAQQQADGNSSHLMTMWKGHRLYDMEDVLGKLPASKQKKPVYKLFTAALQNAWMQADSSQKTLQQINDQQLKALPDSLRFLFHSIELDNHIKLFEYKKAAKTGALLLDQFSSFYTAEELTGFREANSIWEAMSQQVPQQISHQGNTALSVKRDIAGLMNIAVANTDTAFNFVFDTGAGISTIMETYAGKLNLQMISGVTVPIRSGITGIPTQARLGIAKRLRVGNMEITNTLFLVFPDSALSFAGGAYTIKGIVGFPVIKEMGELTFRNDSLYVSPGSITVNHERNMAVDNLKPYLFLEYKGKRLPFTFDTGAQESLFSDVFYRYDRANIDSIGKSSTKKMGGTNGSKLFNGFLVPELSFSIQQHTVTLKDVFVSKEKINTTGDDYYGNIGKDLIRNFRSMTLNFKKGYVNFER
jgi:predicted aspartyl protease